MRFFFLIFLSTIFLAACADKKPSPIVQTDTAIQTTGIPEKEYGENWKPPHIWLDSLKQNQHYCYIKKVFQNGGKTYLRIDFIEIKTGEEADEVRTAVVQKISDKKEDLFKGIKKFGYAFMQIDASTLISVCNPDTTSRIFELGPKAKIDYWNYEASGDWKEENSTDSLLSYDFYFNKEDNYGEPFLIETENPESNILTKIKMEFFGI